mmetsp:Transcript_4507/g.20469  ORF Transcript_4507/g.20469 Transcript_4507/m.20469 type:complete len:200 (+) Transcript_4507:1156-1755(+)
MESDVWRERGLEPVAFMPASYVEGPLHGLADGGDLDTLVPGNVRYLGDGRWRNTVLWEMATRGALQTVNRPPGARDSDDKSIIAHAREVNGMICSNDRYEDHCVGGTSSGGGKDLRRWLRRNRRGYEFRVGSPTDASFKAGRSPPAVSPPAVSAGSPNVTSSSPRWTWSRSPRATRSNRRPRRSSRNRPRRTIRKTRPA